MVINITIYNIMRKCRNCQNILNKLHGFFMLKPFDPVFLGTWQKHCCMRSSNKLSFFESNNLCFYGYFIKVCYKGVICKVYIS